MKLKAIHTYQYVRFQGKNENFLSPGTAEKPNMTMPDLELEILKSGVVSVKTAKDHILIFPTNIAYCVPLTPETANKDTSNRGQIVDSNPSSPAASAMVKPG